MTQGVLHHSSAPSQHTLKECHSGIQTWLINANTIILTIKLKDKNEFLLLLKREEKKIG